MVQIVESVLLKKELNEYPPLREYIPSEIDFNPEDADILNTQFSDKLSLHKAWKEGLYHINPKSYVGIIKLPNGILRLNPKVEISNLFYMLSYAYDVDFFRKQTVQYDDASDIYEFIIAIFNKKVTELIQGGIFRNYLESQENLNYVRGKISIMQNIKENNILQHRLFCVFDDYTANILENQIIKYVLFRLSRDSFKKRYLSDEIRENYYHFDEVSNKIVLPENFPAINYTRMNQHYEHIHKLCKLILEKLSISERTGRNSFSSFLLDMNELFEKFIFRFLDEITRNSNLYDVKIIPQEWYSLDTDSKIKLKPDIIIKKNDVPLIVFDTKYKKKKEKDNINMDIYQVLAYCKGINVKKAVLLYPEWEGECLKIDRIEVKNSDIEIRIMTINLAGDKQTFDRNCINLVKEIMGFAGISVDLGLVSSNILGEKL
jgi:5-methylcytosine-specific restriction enzyme subunit McrC